jgi:hypothetical protein
MYTIHGVYYTPSITVIPVLCVRLCARIRFGEYGRNLHMADNFSKNVNLLHFLVSVTKTFRPSFLFPPTLKYIVKCIATEISIRHYCDKNYFD